MSDWKKDSPIVGDWKKEAPLVEAAPARVASPTGWRAPEQGFADKLAAASERQAQLEPDILGAVVAGLSGPSLFESQIEGAKQAAGALFTPGASMADEYRKGRDRTRAEVGQARKEHPIAPVVGSILGGPVSAETIPGRLLGGYLQGGAKALSDSPADLTKGELEPALMDAERGAEFGLGAAGAGEVIGGGSRWLGNKAAAIRPAQRELSKKAADSAFASGRGAAGGDASNLNRVVETMDRLRNDPRVDQALRESINQFLDSPDGVAALNQLARSTLWRSSDAVARSAKSRDAMTDLAQGLAPEAIEKATDVRMNDWGPVWDRLQRLLRRQAPTAVGAALGGAPGAVAGSMVGSAMGAPGTTAAGIFKAPVIAEPVLNAGAAALGTPARSAGLLGEYIRMLRDEKEEFKP